jgi:cytochrome c biogenesis protein ResB
MKNGTLEKLNKFLVSRQFAVWSLVVLAAFLTVGGTLPDLTLLSEKELAQLQQSRPFLTWLSSKFQVHQLTRSPVFLILPAAIWLSIMLCTVRRVRSRVARPAGGHSGGEIIQGSSPITFNQPLVSTLEKIRTVLNGRRWKLEETKENDSIRYFAQKGAHGLWGSVIFHLSMLVFLLGMIASILARFDAEMILTEGQTLPLTEDQVLRINRNGIFSPRLPGTQVTLRQFESKFVQDKYPVDFAAHLKLSDGGAPVREGAVKVNKPLKLNQWQIFLHRYGYAPKFQISDENGRLLFDSFVNLVASEPGRTDYFDVHSPALRVESMFLPFSQKENNSPGSGKVVPGVPLMHIRVTESGSSTLGERNIALGQSGRFGNYDITFADLRHWAWFGIAYDPGYPFIVLGFLLCIAGLALRFLIPEKWLQVKVWEKDSTPVVSLAGGSRYFPALFQRELGDICGELQSQVKLVRGESGNGMRRYP